MHANDGKMPYRHIIVALNGSELAERVLPHVKSLTRYCGSTITLLRVVTPVEALLFAGTVLEPLTARRHAALEQTTRELHADAVRYLTSLRDRLAAGGLGVDCASPRGAASEVIVEQARDRGAELIAMTTHGRGGLTRWVFGSVAEDVVRRAPCPCCWCPPAKMARAMSRKARGVTRLWSLQWVRTSSERSGGGRQPGAWAED